MWVRSRKANILTTARLKLSCDGPECYSLPGNSPVEGSVSSIGTAVKSNAFQLPLSFFGFKRGPRDSLAPAVTTAAAAGEAAGEALLLQATNELCTQAVAPRACNTY